MMRFNASGEFNVPFCKKRKRFSPSYVTKICNQISWVSEQMRDKDWRFLSQDWRLTFGEIEKDDFVYIDPPYNSRHTDYFNKWSDEEADELAVEIRKLNAGFAYSTWKENKYRRNDHLIRHFSNYPIRTFEHFYHVGSTENLRNSMEEALVISPSNVADESEESLAWEIQQQLKLF
jgi:DNA adenine methylase